MLEHVVRVLLVERDIPHIEAIEHVLATHPGRFYLDVVANLDQAAEAITQHSPDILIGDHSLLDGEDIDLLSGEGDAIPLIVMAKDESASAAVEAIKAGALDYLVKSKSTFTRIPQIILRCLDEWQQMVRRREAEHALRGSERWLYSVFDHLPQRIFVKDRAGRYVLANRATAETYGVSPDELIGKHPRELGTPSDQCRQYQADEQEVLKTGQPKQIPEEYFTAPDGHTICMQTTKSLVDLPNGDPGVLGVAIDITEQKKAQEREQELQARAEEQDRLAAVGQLAAGIAHDFNNMLTGVMGYAQMILMRPNLDEALKADLQIIVEQGERGAQLIRQILDFSRKSVIETQPLNLLVFLKEAVKLLHRTISENVRIVLIEPDRRYMVNVAPTQIQQMLTNLAVNARDAMPEGGELRIELSHQEITTEDDVPFPGMSPGNWVVLSVSDTGVGIPEEIQLRIFEPFFTTKEVGEGTGLGLAQVYGIVGQHDGFIDLESEEGKGATFRIYLPCIEAKPASEEASSDTDIPRGSGETILVVEDDPNVLEIAIRLLLLLDYKVLTANNGNEALIQHADHQDSIDAVLSDTVMPELGGIQLYELLHDASPDLKFVLMSGYPLKAENEEMFARNSIGWIQKPLSLVKLARVLKDVLRNGT